MSTRFPPFFIGHHRMQLATVDALATLEEKINDKSALVGIYGLGYVGLPLALRFAEVGLKVLGFDIDNAKVQQLNAGGSYIERLGAMGADAEANANPPRLLAEVIYGALSSNNPRANYSVKADALRAILTYMPTRLADWILYRVCQPK